MLMTAGQNHTYIHNYVNIPLFDEDVLHSSGTVTATMYTLILYKRHHCRVTWQHQIEHV